MNQILLNSPSQIHKSERSGVQAFKFKLFAMLSFMVLYTNYTKGQDYIIRDNISLIDGPTTFIQNNPFPTSTSTACSLEVGKSFLFQPTRSIFYGGNLGVAQDISNYGDYLGKWSFTGSWRKQGLYSTSSTVNRLDFLVNYHRWGNYAAHFGLRAESTSDVGNTDIPSARKDAVISWASEFGVTANRLIFQSIEGVDYAGSGSTTNDIDHEWATILSNGNIGSGTSAPTAQFQIKPLSTPGTPLMEVLDGSSNPMFTFVEGSIGGVFNTVGQHSVTSPTGVTSSTYKPFRVIDKTGTGYEIFSILDNGSTTIRSNAAASGTDKILTLKNHSGSDVFFANDNGNINLSIGHLFLPAISGSGIPTTTSYYNILAINSSGQVVSGPAPTANTLWEMGGNALSTTGIIGSKSDIDVDFKVGTSLTLAYKVHGVSSSLRGYTEFNNPISVGVSPSANWTLNLKSAGTIAGTHGVLNCVNNAGTATILKLDDGGNMYLPGIAPATGQSFLGIDASGQLSSMAANNAYWASSGNTFTGSGATYSFGTTSHTSGTVYPDDKIEFFAGGIKVFDVWNGSSSSAIHEGSTNFTRNVSIQGGSTTTDYPDGNGGLTATSNCNNKYYSLNIRSAIDPTHSDYETKGILRCVDVNNTSVMTVGAKVIQIFENTQFEKSKIIFFDASAYSTTNEMTVWGKTLVKNSIIPNRHSSTDIVNLGGAITSGGTIHRFDKIYTKDMDISGIIECNSLKLDRLFAQTTTSELGEQLKPFNYIYGVNLGDNIGAGHPFANVYSTNAYIDIIEADNIMPKNTSSNIGGPSSLTIFNETYSTKFYGDNFLPYSTGINNIGASGNGFDNIFGKTFKPHTSGTSDIGTGTTDCFDQIWGNNIYVDQLLPMGSSSTLGTSGNRFDEIWCTQANINTSDIRLKENISDLNHGLNTILKLKPYSYNFKNKEFLHYGFIAQELKNIFPNSIVHGKETDSTYLGVAYSEFIPILTLAMQEQQVIIEYQQASIDSLKEKLNLVFAGNQIRNHETKSNQKEVLNQIPLLFQNHPNPFDGVTFIDYFLPDNTSNAFLKVIDNTGKLVKAFSINKTGFGQVELDCNNLAKGTYYYTLLVNNQAVDSKQMIISKATDY